VALGLRAQSGNRVKAKEGTRKARLFGDWNPLCPGWGQKTTREIKETGHNQPRSNFIRKHPGKGEGSQKKKDPMKQEVGKHEFFGLGLVPKKANALGGVKTPPEEKKKRIFFRLFHLGDKNGGDGERGQKRKKKKKRGTRPIRTPPSPLSPVLVRDTPG